MVEQRRNHEAKNSMLHALFTDLKKSSFKNTWLTYILLTESWPIYFYILSVSFQADFTYFLS